MTMAAPLFAGGTAGVIGPTPTVTLASTSAAVTPGMWVCATGNAASKQYTKATPAAVKAAGGLAGMAVTGAAPGGAFAIAVPGDIVSSAIVGSTGAGGATGVVAVNASATSSFVARPSGAEYIGGTIDDQGNVTIMPYGRTGKGPHHVYNIRSAKYGGAPSTDPTAQLFGLAGGATGVDNWQPIVAAMADMGTSGGILYFPPNDDGTVAAYLVGTQANGPIPVGTGNSGGFKPITFRGDAGFFDPQSVIVGDHDVTTIKFFGGADSPDGTFAVGSIFEFLGCRQPIAWQPETWAFWQAHGGTVNSDTRMIPSEPHGAQGVYYKGPVTPGTPTLPEPVFPTEWQSSFFFATNDEILLTTHDVPSLTAPVKMKRTGGATGITGSSAPAWDVVAGHTTTDGGVVWTAQASNVTADAGGFNWTPLFFANGIESTTIITVRYSHFDTINGDMVHIEASAGGGGTDANGCFVEYNRFYVSAGAGLFLRGPDANATTSIGNDCLQNGDYGIDDRCFLQSTHIGCQAAACVRGPYCAWENPSPVAKIIFVGCYSEGGQPESRVRAPAFCIGGLHAAGFTDDSGPQFVDLFNVDAFPVNVFSTRNAWGLVDGWPVTNAKRKLGDKTRAQPDNGHTFQVSGGTTFLEGNTQPVWNTASGGTTNDGGLVWTEIGSSACKAQPGTFKDPTRIYEYYSSLQASLLTVATYQHLFNDGSLSGSPGIGWTRETSESTDGFVSRGVSSNLAQELAGWQWVFQTFFGSGAARKMRRLLINVLDTVATTGKNGNAYDSGGDVDENADAQAEGDPWGFLKKNQSFTAGQVFDYLPVGYVEPMGPRAVWGRDCVWWLRSDRGVLLNAAGTLVTKWTDYSGWNDPNRDVTFAGGAEANWNASVAQFNNLPTLGAVGATQGKTGIWTTSYNDPVTAYFVARDSGSANNGFMLSALTSGFSLYTQGSSSPAHSLAIDEGVGAGLLTSSPINTTAHVVGVKWNGASSAIYLDAKTAIATGTAGAQVNAFGSGGISLFAYKTGQAGTLFTGDIAEVIVVRNWDSTRHRRLLDRYLGPRYNVSIGA